MPFDATVTFEDGTQHVYKGVPDGTPPDMVSAQATKEFGRPVKSLDGGVPDKLEGVKEVGRVADQALRRGAAGLPGIIGEVGAQAIKASSGKVDTGMGLAMVPQLLTNLYRGATGAENPWDKVKFGDVTHAIETAGGTLPDVQMPKSDVGKAVGNTLEPVIGTVTGGGAGSTMSKVLIGLASGAGGETAARLFGDNALTRFLGSLTGGGLAGVAQNFKPNAEKLIRQATEGMNDLDWTKAQAIEKVLGANEIPHLKSQLLGPRSTLDDVVAVAGTNPAARPALESAVERSGSKSQAALKNFVAGNLPPPLNLGERRDVLSDVQAAAQTVLDGIKTKGNNAFKAAMPAEGGQYDPAHMQGLHDELVTLAESSKFGKGTAGHDFLKSIANKLMHGESDQLDDLVGAAAKAPTTDQHIVNNVIKDLNQIAEKEGYKGFAIDEAKRVLKAGTPEFDAAREAKTAIINQELLPASKGLTGDLAHVGGGVKPDRTTATDLALTKVFPPNRPQPQAILALEKTMGGDSVGQLLREHLAQQMEAAVGMKGQGPGSFVANVAGTSAQRQNLNAALEATARANGVEPGPVRKGFYQLMKAFDSFKDLKLPESIDRAALQQESGKNLGSFVVAPGSRLGRTLWERTTKKTFQDIAEIVTSPDGLAKLRAISQSPKPETARAVALGIVLSTQEGLPKEGE